MNSENYSENLQVKLISKMPFRRSQEESAKRREADLTFFSEGKV